MMTDKNNRIFDQYNHASNVQRAPKGRAFMRDLLSDYAYAAIHLYGVIPIDAFVEIFNQHHEFQTTHEEVEILLLPTILKKREYAFYQAKIVHYWMLDNFSYADYIIAEQGDKPRYVPKATEFLHYLDYRYGRPASFERFKKFIQNRFKVHPHLDLYFEDTYGLLAYDFKIQRILDLLDKYGLELKSENEVHAFVELISQVKNDIRIWENNAFTPTELAKLQDSKPQKPMVTAIQSHKSIGRNEPCPCGSGKKYKKCCYLNETLKSATLTENENVLFYTTWHDLLRYVNKTLDIYSTASYEKTMHNDDEMNYEISRELWKHPELISEYCNSGKQLLPEQISLLQSWQHNRKQGVFMVIGYEEGRALFYDGESDEIFGVKGMATPLTKIFKKQLPITIETTLLPFNETIVYDTFIAEYSVSYGENISTKLIELSDKARAEKTIRKSLNTVSNTKDKS